MLYSPHKKDVRGNTNMSLIQSLTSNLQSSSLLSRSALEVLSSSKRLTTGNRLAQTSDDVAASAIGAQLVSELVGLRSARSSISQGSSLLQVASGAASQISEALERQQTLALQAGNGALNDANRQALNQEFQALSEQINQIAASTNFNGVNLLGGGQNINAGLVQTNAGAAAFNPGAANASNGVGVASAVAVQAFDSSSGASLNGAAAPGQLQLVNSSGAPLADAAFNSVSTAVSGKFTDFELSDVNYGSSATLTATIGGVEFTGTVTQGATTAMLSNGTTNIQLGLSPVSLTDSAAVANTEATIANDFANTTILRTTNLSGIDFTGTGLEGAVGTAATGIASARLEDTSSVSINNFRFVGSTGVNNNTLAVDVNGKTFTATGVRDAVDDTAAARYTFTDGSGQALTLDLTGLSAGAGAIGNIRTSASDQQEFINSLNSGFAKAGGGLNFATGDGNSIGISLASVTTNNLFNGQSLDISTTAGANAAASVLGQAITKATSLQADIGANQARFEAAEDTLRIAIENQDAARSTLLDTDIAQESTNFANSVLRQKAGISVLAQTNKLSGGLLKLLQ